ncbi:MAG: hypothetical protein WA902_15755 [Thermosynechococcaceae cyanobacterium]
MPLKFVYTALLTGFCVACTTAKGPVSHATSAPAEVFPATAQTATQTSSRREARLGSAAKSPRSVLPAAALAVKPGEIDGFQLRLGGFGLDASEAEITKKLGPPKSRHDFGYQKTLNYNGLTISILDDDVLGIQATSPEFCTPAGACPGQDIDQVFLKYGQTKISVRDGVQRVEYYIPDESCWLSFKIDDQTVSEAAVLCQP